MKLLRSIAGTVPYIQEAIGWLLVHSLWQFALVALTAWSFGRAMRDSSASSRYVMLIAMFSIAIGAPMVTWFLLPASQPVAHVQDVGGIPGGNKPATETRELPEDFAGMVVLQELDPGKSPAVAKETQPSPMIFHAEQWTPIWSQCTRVLESQLPAIVLIWLLGVTLFSLRPVLSWITIRQLRSRGVSQVDETVEAMLGRLKRQLGIRQRVSVLRSTFVTSPIVVGCFRSVVVLPISLISNLPPSQLEAILAHELAHVRRYDFLVNLIQTLTETLFFYHPAIWWLSHRIRMERENCCDDLVVVALGDKVEYGRALLAIESHRSSTLAIGACDGSLLARVRRLFASEPRSYRRSSAGVVGLSLLVTGILASVIGVALVAADAGESDGESKVPFGVKSNGVQCRLIPISPNSDDDYPDLSRSAERFVRSANMAFAVELKNVSDEPITLAGVRYATSYAAELQGKLNTASLAPHLFEFEFVDTDGNAVRRAHREFFDGWHVLKGASVHELAPGESLVEVLRPAKLNSPMDYDLPQGKYAVRVRYRGPDAQFRNNVRRSWPDEPILNTWAHSVESNVADFSIEESTPRTAPEDLVWGPEQDGLKAAIEYQLPNTGDPLVKPGVPVGTNIGVVFHIRNVSSEPIKFISETFRQGDSVVVTSEAGEKIDVKEAFFTGVPIDVAWKLMPGDVAQLHVLAPAINGIDQPGHYTIRYTIRFRSRVLKDDAGQVIFPRPGDYDKELVTGDTPLVLHRDGNPAGVSSVDESQVQSLLSSPEDAIVRTRAAEKDDGTNVVPNMFDESAGSTTVVLSDAVRQFNEENRNLERGIGQPQLTTDEVLEAIVKADLKRDAKDLNESEFLSLKSITETGKLPPTSFLYVYTERRTDTFSFRQQWKVQLLIPAIGHDGFVRFTIRNTTIADEVIDPRMVAWGKPDIDGLSLGIYLSPRKAYYAIGERVRLRIYVRNEGRSKVSLTTPNTSHPGEDAFSVVDTAGGKVPVELGHKDWIVPWISGATAGGLAPGEVHGFSVPFQIRIGGSAEPNKLVGLVVKARAGQSLSFKLRSHVGNQRSAASAQYIVPVSGDVKFAVANSTSNLPWRATGTVVDGSGKPLKGVRVRAATGVGSLRGGGTGVTDENGHYDFRFGMGIRFSKSDDGKPSTQTQYAIIYASLEGYFEKDYCQNGNGIASLQPVSGDDLELWSVTASQVCLPEVPREIDFVMLPAARVSGTLVDENDQPLHEYSVSLTGEELPPGSSVLAQVRTDETGRFEISDIPTTVPFQFEVRKPRSELKPPWDDSWAGPPVVFRDPGKNDFAAIAKFPRGANGKSPREKAMRLDVETFQLKVMGPGVHGRTAVARAKQKQLEISKDSDRKDADGAAAGQINTDKLTIYLTNDEPN